MPSSHKSLKTHPNTGGNFFKSWEKLLAMRHKCKLPNFVFTSKPLSHHFICSNRTENGLKLNSCGSKPVPQKELIDFAHGLGYFRTLRTVRQAFHVLYLYLAKNVDQQETLLVRPIFHLSDISIPAKTDSSAFWSQLHVSPSFFKRSPPLDCVALPALFRPTQLFNSTTPELKTKHCTREVRWNSCWEGCREQQFLLNRRQRKLETYYKLQHNPKDPLDVRVSFFPITEDGLFKPRVKNLEDQKLDSWVQFPHHQIDSRVFENQCASVHGNFWSHLSHQVHERWLTIGGVIQPDFYQLWGQPQAVAFHRAWLQQTRSIWIQTDRDQTFFTSECVAWLITLNHEANLMA